MYSIGVRFLTQNLFRFFALWTSISLNSAQSTFFAIGRILTIIADYATFSYTRIGATQTKLHQDEEM